MAHDRSQQFGHVGFAFDEIGVGDHFTRPELKADGVGGDDRADGQGALGNQHFGALGNGLCRFSLRRCGAGEHAPCDQRRSDRNDQRAKQQNQLLPIHGFTRPLVCPPARRDGRLWFRGIKPDWLRSRFQPKAAAGVVESSVPVATTQIPPVAIARPYGTRICSS